MSNKKPYDRVVFPNGVRLLFVPMEGVGSVATSVMVACGSRYENPQINGVSHFLEHMVFKGTQKYPTTDDVNIIEKIGGLQNAYTDVDITSYHNKVVSTDTVLALEINRELAIKPKLEQKHIDKERDVILEEMKRYEDEPAIKVEETFHQMLYPGTTLGMRVIGEKSSLRHLQGLSLRSYHEKWYVPDRIVVVVAGNIKRQAESVKKKTEEWFGNLSLHAPRSRLKDGAKNTGLEEVIDKQDKPQLAVVTKPDAQQAHLVLGFRTFRRDSEDRFGWSVLNLIAGVGFTSRLFRQIREKRGLCYHIRSASNNWFDVGNWSIYAGVATNKVEEAVRAILAELAKARDKGVTENEVEVAKKRIKTMLAFRSEDPEFQNEYYGRQEVFHEPIMTIDEYIKRIESITKVDISRLMEKYLRTNTINMSLVWNKPKDEKIQSLLAL